MKKKRLAAAMQTVLGQLRLSPVQSVVLLAVAVSSSVNAQNIDTTPAWNGTNFISTWGVPNTATYGQTITASAQQSNLLDFTFNLKPTGGTAPQYQAFVYQWNGTRITGSALYSSAVMTAPSGSAFVPITFNTGGTHLVANQQYVLFLTTSTVSGQANGTAVWGSVSNNATYSGGQFVYMNNGTTFGNLSVNNWNTIAQDLAFIATFSPLVYTSSLAEGNNPALNASRVIDSNSNLSALFASQSSQSQISNAASQTLPLLTGSSMVATQSALSGINRIIQARIEANRGLSSGDDFTGDKNVWMKPFGSWADQSDRNGVAGYKANTYGLAFGVDAALSPAFRLGGAFAYARSDINGQSAVAPQSVDVDVYQLIGYGSYSLNDRTDINFQADIGQNSNKGRRQIAFTSSVASSGYDSDTAHVGLGIGRTYALSSQTTLTPSIRADYTWIKDKGYAETGAGLLNLTVNGRTAEALVFGIDGKLAHQLNSQTSLIANLGVGYDALNEQASITSAFAGAPGAAFITYGLDPSPWLVRGGVGAVYKTTGGLEVTGRYDAEYRESFLNQTASVKVRWAF